MAQMHHKPNVVKENDPCCSSTSAVEITASSKEVKDNIVAPLTVNEVRIIMGPRIYGGSRKRSASDPRRAFCDVWKIDLDPFFVIFT